VPFHYPSIPRCAKFNEHVVSEKYWYVCLCMATEFAYAWVWEWWFLFVFDNKFVDLLSFSFPLCNASNTYQKFVANTCKLKCAIYTGHSHTYAASHLLTCTFGHTVVACSQCCFCHCCRTRTRHMQLLSAAFVLPSSSCHPHSSLSTWPPTFARFNT